MSKATDERREPASERDSLREGLCSGCRHRRVVSSVRSTFVRCALGTTAGDWPRYPRLPVVECSRYEKSGETVG